MSSLSNSLAAAAPDLRERWRRRLVFAAMFSALWLVILGDGAIKDGSRAAMDLMVRLSPPAATTGPPVWIIDVDEETWRLPAWGGGEPAIAPRDGLLRLLEHAVSSGARYVVLDVVVEGADAGDAALADGVERLARRLDAEGGRRHLLFVRSLRRPLSKGSSEPPLLRASALDAVLARHPGTLHAVSPGLVLSDDGLVRRWRLWDVACVAGGAGGDRWIVLPSAHLTIAALETGSPHAWNDVGGSCAADPEAPRVGPTAGEVDALMWKQLAKMPKATRQQRISGDDASRQLTSAILFGRDLGGDGRIPAHAALDAAPDSRLRGALVFIGQSFGAAGDRHATPVGRMPGVRVLADGAGSFLSMGMLRLPHGLVTAMVYLAAIALTSLLHARFNATVATVLLGPLLLLTGFGLSAVAFRRGVWVDFMTPVALGNAITIAFSAWDDIWPGVWRFFKQKLWPPVEAAWARMKGG